MDKILNRFVKKMQHICGENLVSIILYGSRVSNEIIRHDSDYNIIVVLVDDNLKKIKEIRDILYPIIKRKDLSLVIFSERDLIRSADVFPIEFYDIRDSHKVLYGNDPFEKIDIRDINLRHQCEFELRSKLMRLRQEYIRYFKKPWIIKQVLVDSFTGVVTIFRNILRLFEKEASIQKEDVINLIANKIGIDISPFVKIKKIKERDKESFCYDPLILIEEYISEIQKVIDYIDNQI